MNDLGDTTEKRRILWDDHSVFDNIINNNDQE